MKRNTVTAQVETHDKDVELCYNLMFFLSLLFYFEKCIHIARDHKQEQLAVLFRVFILSLTNVVIYM